MPWAFVCHIPAYLIGEMWIGVLIAVVVDLVPADLSTSSVAVYFFIIQIIGGNLNLLVTPIANAIGLRWAIFITFPGFYLVGAIIFIIPLILLRKQEAEERKEKLKQGDMDGEVNGTQAPALDEKLKLSPTTTDNTHVNQAYEPNGKSDSAADPVYNYNNVQAPPTYDPSGNESLNLRL